MHKSLAKNYEDGFRAFGMVERRNTSKYGPRYHQMANPLKPNTTPYREWQRGWDAAYFKNLEKLNGTGTRG